MRKNIYKWHRTLSLIIALPVFLWAASGFMHPIMTNIRPHVATQWLKPVVIDTTQTRVSLQAALEKNNIYHISNVRIVQMGGNQFYQVQLPGQAALQYFSTQNGNLLRNGDNLYAMTLAKKFLEGEKDRKPAPLFASLNKSVRVAEEGIDVMHDCCANTTAAILYDTTGAFVNDVSMVQSFTDEYKYINRLLPVYRIGFNRADGIRIYVETGQDRFAFAMDNKRAAFDKVFTLFHTLGWLDFMGNAKHVVAAILTLLAFATTLMGIYIFVVTRTKKPNGNPVMKARKNHRWTSISISLFTLMFTGSGAFHAIKKIAPGEKEAVVNTKPFNTKDLTLDIAHLREVAGADITNVSLARIGDTMYWQVYPQKDDHTSLSTAPLPLYINANTYQQLPDGDLVYARYLAGLYTQHADDETKDIERITKFTNEYGFVNKRLPVWKIRYDVRQHERFYIETSSGKVAARIDDNDMIEGYSFAMLHKHEFMGWAGKPVKDFSTMFWAAAQIAMIVVGLTLYYRIKSRKV